MHACVREPPNGEEETRMLRAIVYSTLFALCLVSGPASAKPDNPPPWSRWEQKVHRMDLQPEQKEKVAKILEESRKEREEIQARVRQATTELNDLLRQPDVKEQAVLKQADKLGELRTERQKAMLRALLKVRAELTPQQREQLLSEAPSGGAKPTRRPPAAAAAPSAPTPAATP